MSIKELREIAKERGLTNRDAIRHGAVQRKDTWIKLLLNPEKKAKQQEIVSLKSPVSISGYKTSKQKDVQGLTRLPEIKTTVYFYGATK